MRSSSSNWSSLSADCEVRRLYTMSFAFLCGIIEIPGRD